MGILTVGQERQSPSSRGGWWIWSLAVGFYFYEFMLQTSTGVMVPDLMRAFQASGEQLGQLSAAYLYTYACMQIPAGLFMDRWGPQRLLVIAPVLCALGCGLFVFSSTLLVAGLARALMGVGASFAVIGCLKVASLYFDYRHFSYLAGLMVAVGMLGAAGGQAPMAYITAQLGWRDTILYFGFLGLLLAACIAYSLYRMRPQMIQHVAKKEKLSLWNMCYALRHVVLCRQTWIASIYAGLMFVPTIGFAGLWGVPFLMQAYDLTRPSAALMISCLYVGWAIGGPIFGAYSDRIGRRLRPMYYANIGTLAVMCYIWWVPTHWICMALALILLGFFSSGFVLAFSLVRELHTDQQTGAAMGFINTLNSFSGALSQPLLGWFLDQSWTGGFSEGARLYTLASYQQAFLAVPLCLILSLCCLPWLRETFARPVHHDAEKA